MEFEMDHRVKREVTKDGREITYTYKFKGTDESNKTILTLKTEVPIEITRGAIIEIEFEDKQTKVN